MRFASSLTTVLDNNVEWIVFAVMLVVSIGGLIRICTRKPGKPW